jgi:uncharacterized protein
MDKTKIINSIRETLKKISPESKAIIFGSQARGTAGPDSDWDILILVDKPHLTTEDYDDVAYPIRELGWEIGEQINPVLYTLKEWSKNSFTLFYKNVMKEGFAL